MNRVSAEAAVLDWLLAAGLLCTAVWSLAARDLFQGVTLYVSFGLLLALAWARLEAIDLAIAEAAIGAGITGALLLAALTPKRPRSDDD
jgi:uncharacterized MnhB-related membrane protein